jgi:hypothetical protein
MSFGKRLAVLLVSSVLVASNTLAHEQVASATHTAAEAGSTVPLYEDLGTLTYPVTTHNKLVQRYFDQGLRLTYAFNLA